ncbi:hypothetical protein QAD02_013143 [Eretmocerus hayati]|uniref:Uncharacterized protein n=1 Tax=Eretmocerus hayati TaxID=131215 RepID=A0ACC2P2S6_9HYME|nr:hypothetical protein QAD02_013143 [Eretmocerus hayati]
MPELVQMGYTADEEIFCATSIKINGVEFRGNLFIVLEKAEARDDHLLGFGRIKEIVMIGIDNIFSLTPVCQTLFFDTSLNAYKIELRDVRDSESFVRTPLLPFYEPFSSCRKAGSDAIYISLRHIIA